jgi:hypothetical protein
LINSSGEVVFPVNVIPVHWEYPDEKPWWLFAVALGLSFISFIYMFLDTETQGIPLTAKYQIAIGVSVIVILGFIVYKSIFISVLNTECPSLKYLFLFALLFRLLWAIIIYNWSVGIGWDGAIARDDAYYYDLGALMAQNYQGGDLIIPAFGGYYLFNMLVNIVSGGNYFMTMAFNSLVGAATVLYVYQCTVLIFGAQVAWLGAILTAVSPELGMWSATNLKDTQVIFICVFSTYWLVQFAKSQQLKMPLLVLLLVLNAYLAVMRPVFIFFFLVMGVVYLFVSKPRRMRAAFSLRITGGMVLILAVLFAAGYYPGSEKFELLQKYQQAREGVEASFSGESVMALASPMAIRERPYLIPVALGFSLITPFPFWKLTVVEDNAEAMLAVPGVLFWYILILPTFYGVWVSLRRNWKVALPLVGWVIFIVFAVTWEAGGAGFRYRAAMLPFAYPLAAVGLAEASQWRPLIPFAFLGFLCLCLSYVFIKI